MSDGRLRIEVGKFGASTHVSLDEHPIYPVGLTINAEAGRKTSIVLEPSFQYSPPVFFDVMDAASIIRTPVGEYVLVSAKLFELMRLAYERQWSGKSHE